jgi:hypothetical protein
MAGRGAVRLAPLEHRPVPPPVKLNWSTVEAVKDRTYQSIKARLGCDDLNDKQKEHVAIVYNSLEIPNGDWKPEDQPDLLTSAVNRCSWVASPAFRLRVYGEFCQYLHPELMFEELGQLRDSEKKDAEFFFLQSAGRAHLLTHLDQIRDAVAEFSTKYPRVHSSTAQAFEGGNQFMQMLMADEARISAEMEQRWK